MANLLSRHTAVPARQAGDGARDLPSLTPRAHSCWRCSISVARCIELRPQRKALGPFNVGKDQIDDTKRVCYWCQRDWDVFWKDLRADVTAFSRAQVLSPA